MRLLKFSLSALVFLFLFSLLSCRSVPEVEPDMPPAIEEDFEELLPEDPLADDPADDIDDVYDDPFDQELEDEDENQVEDIAEQELEFIDEIDDEELPGDVEEIEPLLAEEFPLEEEIPADEEPLLEEELLVEEEPLLEEEPLVEEEAPLEEELPLEEETFAEEEALVEEDPVLEEVLPVLPEEQLPAEEIIIEPPPPPPPVPPPPPQQQVPPQEQRPEPPAFLRPAEPEIVPPAPPQAPPLINIPGPPPWQMPEPSGDEIVFSRIVRATVGQIVEIPFRGTGWIFLGELGNRRGMNYSSRRLDVEAGITVGQTFVFTAEAAGTYILRFFRQDFIQDYLINDYVQVIIGERGDAAGRIDIHGRDRVIAQPRWPLEPGPPSRWQAPAGMTPPVVTPPFPAEIADQEMPLAPDDLYIFPPSLPGAIAPVTVPPVPPRIESQAEFVQRARQEFDAARIENALNILNAMRQQHPFDDDEALWLRAQLLEANSPARDIRQSLEYYQRLVREFPQSIRVPDARRRIAFLERFFFNIR